MLIARAFLRRGFPLLALAAGLPLAGVLVVVEPALATPLLAVGFVLLAFEAPLPAVGLFLFTHVATPAYVRVPMPGGAYDPPVSTAVLLALIGVGVLAYLARAPMPRPLAPPGRRALAALAVFAAIAATSLVDPRTGAEGINMWAKVFVLPAAVLAAVLCVCRGPRDVERLGTYLMAGGVVASLYAVVEYSLGRNPLLEMYRSELDIRYYTSEVLGPLAYRCFSVYGNPLEFATVMGMIFPFAAIRVAAAGRMREKLVYGAVACILALGIALTFSRGPMLALVTGCAIIGVIYRQMRPWLVGGALAALATLLVAWPLIGAGISDRINDVDNMTLRFKLWETAVAVFSDQPLRGIGIGNFPQYYLEAVREHHIGPFHEFGPSSITAIRVAENAYLQLAAETGVVGFVAGVAAMTIMLLLGVRLARGARDRRTSDLAVAIAVGMVIYAVNGMFITAYTHYFSTLLIVGFLPGCLLVLDRADETGADGDHAAA